MHNLTSRLSFQVMSIRKLHLNRVIVSLNCSCSCIRLKLSDIFHPKPRSSSATTATTKQPVTNSQSHFSSYYASPNMKSPASVGGRFGLMGLRWRRTRLNRIFDFRQSMLQMIVENEIHSKDDLRELLKCFLQLNSPYHHGIIIRAFTETWNGVLSIRPSSKCVKRKAHLPVA